jgi:hypothetical protein
MITDNYADWDGAYVLGALDPDDLAEYEAHLAGCAECRANVEGLRPTVGVLANARVAGFTGSTEPVPDTLLPGLLHRAARDRNRRRTFIAVLGAAAAACIVALAVVLWPGSGTSDAAAPQAMRALRPSPVSATAALVAKAWGTEIDLQCRYNEPVHESFPYKLRVIDKSGRHHGGGSWSLESGRQISFTGGTDVPLQDVQAVQITLSDGKPILQLDASPR